MVSSPIGGFMPIPLAIMPPFMAYQSLLMGDSFGKGFQYGKRKISAMTNEEFNNLSLPNLFRDSMNEYESMIPTVEKAMVNSTKLQNSIIEKMLKILPELLASFFQGGTDAPLAGDSPFLKNQTDVAQNASLQAMQAQIQNIRYTTDRDPVFNSPAIEELQKQLDQALLEQRGDKESLAEKLKDKPPPPPPPTPPTTEELKQGAQLNADEEWRAWSIKLSKLKQQYNVNKKAYKALPTNAHHHKRRLNQSRQATLRNEQRVILSAMRRISLNDQRSPNNNIRKDAIRLRQAMQTIYTSGF